MSGLSLRGVSHGYGAGSRRVAVLHAITLAVEPGEVVALLGPSGSGKTTVCHLAAGFEEPDAGTVEVDGRSPATAADWSLVAVVPQQHGLVEGLGVEENVLLPTYRSTTAAVPFARLADELDLGAFAHRRVGETSLGEQQRIAVARGLVLSPRVLVLDEPTGHQDDDRAELVTAALVGAARVGSAVLVSSHDSRVRAIADRVLRLDEGRLLHD
ncbi:ABC transporter ATP-binding protein [Nocardioides deserti]|uniref:ATP-binding cassette domain-containing protein n=1 Tax=Nocardioides deserti TaxID=1588644 RepID=A0ABR6U405_9ACTN|nr:ATP-binding cassette domain-containing protein [Nocardioides deserti]MBC2959166.1 ATP-binding cassette domain-containing protein [Nocardioides deserti]GGO68516.1 macrolide ABC transporter ATP-binding protein [Nocardioides deserti]